MKGAWWQPVARLLPRKEAKRQAQQDLAERYCLAGQSKVAGGRWASALASYNRALCLQREALGEDHPVTGETLNSIGVCLMNLGEFGASSTSLNEALYIRLASFGPDSEEAKETKHNIEQLIEREQGKQPSASKTIRMGSSDDSFRRHSELVSDKIDWHYDEFAHATQRRHSEGSALHAEQKAPNKVDWHYNEFFAGETPDGDHGSITGGTVTTVATADEDTVHDHEVEEDEAHDSSDRLEFADGTDTNPQRGDNLRSSAEISSAVDDIVENEVANIMASLSSFQVGPEGEVQLSNKDDGTSRRGSLKMVTF